jgi:hypothetical protein
VTAVSRLAVFVACALMVAFPQLAEACPTCAAREPGGPARIVALGAMILLPFGIAFAVWRALRSAAGDRGGPEPDDRGERDDREEGNR